MPERQSEDTPAHLPIGIEGIGFYVPPQLVTAAGLADQTGIDADIIRQKFGVRQVHRAGPDCHVSDMAVLAGQAALDDAGVHPDDVDLVVYCGSEYKDFIVWSAAVQVAHRLGCSQAEAYEVYALCAGAPVALRVVRDMMLAEPAIRRALVVAASKERDLVDRASGRTRFMLNFGDGAGAAVVRRGLDRNRLLGAFSLVDGSLSEEVIVPAGGSRLPASEETVRCGAHYLDVPDLERMRDRLNMVSGPNFLHVVQTALQRSGYQRIDFLAAVHMKRSMHEWLQRELGADRSLYLENFGHMQSADQFVILSEARRRGILRNGDVVALVAAGVGYTWAAMILIWGEREGQYATEPSWPA